ncbi:hydrolase [Nocardia neocaledoniensis NBRC 108232]|uniref:Putative hydrolase of the HAD superfamily n=1 Tax=Nocardia neocaledoniensis TaxID=236511 RepID=A0A317N583_9NOCA|nr:HAD family hydrolase [Nocardia neocaledoniensis]PWV69817.1 putative hydrolase of the HAD superfamily [Nocardia neocaledoniensis]GEM33455.1 hydrolase [Nocardia neocaledoniensis NBRC 108232]
MPIRGVLFDVDDTLFDYSASDAAGLLAQLGQDGMLDRFPDPAAAVELWSGITETEYPRFVRGELSFTGQRLARARAFLSHVWRTDPADIPEADAIAWFDGYTAHRRAAWAAFPDAAPLLATLAPAFRLGIVSNAAVPPQRRKLEAVGLLSYFGDRVVCSEEHGAGKPEASIFHAGCALLELDPGEVAYVGDRYTVDALGAHDAGLHACWLDRANLRAGTDVRPGVHVIGSLAELPGTFPGHRIPVA